MLRELCDRTRKEFNLCIGRILVLDFAFPSHCFELLEIHNAIAISVKSLEEFQPSRSIIEITANASEIPLLERPVEINTIIKLIRPFI